MGGSFNLNILELAGLSVVEGDVGIEIEAEFSKELRSGTLGYWSKVSDGSLRGNSCEFVLRKPIDISAVPKALSEVYKVLKSSSLRDPSENCSTHVHLNCQTMTVKQVVTFVCCLIILEPLLLKACSPNRKGNLFCVDAANCEGLLDSLESFASRGRIPSANSAKYSGINLSSLGFFGSVEMRHMHFPVDQEHLNAWVNVLHSIKVNSLEWFDSEDPTDLLDKFSSVGIIEFISTIAPELKNLVDCEDHDSLQDCRLNMRLAQPALYESLHSDIGSLSINNTLDSISLRGSSPLRTTNIPLNPMPNSTVAYTTALDYVDLDNRENVYIHTFGNGTPIRYQGFTGNDHAVPRIVRDKLIALLPHHVDESYITALRNRSNASTFILRYQRAIASVT